MNLTSRGSAALTGAAALAVLLTACGSSSSSEASASASAPASVATAETTASAPASSAAASAPAGSGEAVAPVTVDGVTVTGNKGEAPKVTVTAGQAAPTKLVSQDIYEGTGDAMPAGGTGLWNYEGVLFSDGTTFDSSWERGQPIAFGLDQVIPGWRDGLVGMKAGGRRLLIIPPDQAYGARALQGIPPNSTLVFVVDLEDVK